MRIAVIGNSAAALSAVEAVRRHDRRAEVVLISRERHRAYSRVLLPYVLQGRTDSDRMFFPLGRFGWESGVRTLLGRGVVEADLSRKRLLLDDGDRVDFDKLLIASGSSPVRPAIPGLDDEGILHLWTIDDAERLGRRLKAGKRLLVIGGGAISLMLASIAREKKMDVTVIELLPRVMPQVLDGGAADIVEARIRKAGVRLLTGTAVARIDKSPNGDYRVYPAGGRTFRVDVIVVAAGVKPNVDFLDGSLCVGERGIPVDDRMRTSVPDVFAAGDVAKGPTAYGDEPRVDALWTTAVEHGSVAGANMAGKETRYPGCLSAFVSEFFGLTVASVGAVRESPTLRAEVRADSRTGRYAKFFWRGGVPAGALVIGSPDDAASLGVLKTAILKRTAFGGAEPVVGSKSVRRLVPISMDREPAAWLRAAGPTPRIGRNA